MGKGVVGRVAETGQSLLTANARSLPFFDDSHDLKSGYKTMSVLCVPVKLGETVVAVLMLINKLRKVQTGGAPEVGTAIGSPPASPSRHRARGSSSPDAGADAVFDGHDLELAELLAAQVAGPVAHAQEMIDVAQAHTGAGKKQLKSVIKITDVI